MNQYRHLSAFPRTARCWHALKERGVTTGIPEQRRPRDAGRGVKSAGFSGLIDPCSRACHRGYKTDPAAYAIGPHALGLPRATSCSSPAMAGTPSAPPGTASPRCG